MSDRAPMEFEFIEEGWRYLDSYPHLRGWRASEILDIYKAKWPGFVARLGEKSPVSITPESSEGYKGDLVQQNTIMIFAYSLALAARGCSKITMLDWGGSIGHYYLLARALLPEVEIVYSCKDLSGVAEYGQSLLPDATFYSDDAYLAQEYDFVLASGSIQYSQTWEKVFEDLAGVTKRHLLVTRVPVLRSHRQYVFIQRAHSYGYNTEYLAWAVNRDDLLSRAAQLDLGLVREFVTGDTHEIQNAPEQCEYRGFLFEKKGNTG